MPDVDTSTITQSDSMGAIKFVDFVTESMVAYTDEYRMFLDVVDHINRKMLCKFEDFAQESMSKQEEDDSKQD